MGLIPPLEEFTFKLKLEIYIMNYKYEITCERILIPTGKETEPVPLYRIRATKNFGTVKKGDLGGFIEGRHNLNPYDDSWVADNAKVYDNAYISHNAIIKENATANRESRVCESATVGGNALISGTAIISGSAIVDGLASVYGSSKVFDTAHVTGETHVRGEARVGGTSIVVDDDISGKTYLGACI